MFVPLLLLLLGLTLTTLGLRSAQCLFVARRVHPLRLVLLSMLFLLLSVHERTVGCVALLLERCRLRKERARLLLEWRAQNLVFPSGNLCTDMSISVSCLSFSFHGQSIPGASRAW